MSFIDEMRKEKIIDITSSIYVDKILDDSIIKSINKKYLKIYKIHDINYLLSDASGKENILIKYMNFFNNMDFTHGISFILKNRKNNQDYYLKIKDKDDFYSYSVSSPYSTEGDSLITLRCTIKDKNIIQLNDMNLVVFVSCLLNNPKHFHYLF